MMNTHQNTDIIPPVFIGIGKALADYYLQVPRFQRSYAWEEENIQELYEDLATAIRDGEQVYFLGSVVTIQTKDGWLEVVDGQQRLATISILLAAIRDYYHRQNDMKRKEFIEERFLLTTSLENLERLQRMKLNPIDNDFFLHRVINELGDASRLVRPSRSSHEKIELAAQIAAECVDRIIRSSADPLSGLNDWVLYILNSVRVIWFTVSSDANAFMIFETLNDRGLELTVSDLLKNYLFSRSQNRIRDTEAHWLYVVNTFEVVDNPDIIVRYIHNYWSSQFGLTRERELFEKIKERLRKPNDVVEFARSLEGSSKLYIAMLNHEHEEWDRFDQLKLRKYRVRDCVRTLNVLRLEQFRSLLLAVLRKFEDVEIARTINALVSWTVRFVIYGGGGGTLEKRYPEVARKVSQGTLTTADDIYLEMQDIVPNDQEFQTSFATIAISRVFIARYLLSELEQYRRGQSAPELVPNDDPLSVNIEHILPQTESKHWIHFTSEDHKAYRNRLGNQTLLASKKNSKLKDGPFNAKKSVYLDSDFHITKEIAALDNWTREEIETRQAKFAEIAVRVWPQRPPQP